MERKAQGGEGSCWNFHRPREKKKQIMWRKGMSDGREQQNGSQDSVLAGGQKSILYYHLIKLISQHVAATLAFILSCVSTCIHLINVSPIFTPIIGLFSSSPTHEGII